MNPTRQMALLSIATSIVTLALKFGAYFLTGSVSLFSDAAESLVNLTAGLVAFTALTIASRPADEDHTYGHDKAEYFSSGVEGALIMVAALTIIYAAIERFAHPAELHQLGLGLMVSLLAAGANFATARIMLKVARTHDSITLEADAKHLLTDVWTSVGVVGGLAVVMFTPPNWQILDPIIAVLVALNIVKTGVDLMRRSLDGLMDVALPLDEIATIENVLSDELPADATFHALRTRKAGPRRFIDFHLLLQEQTTVKASHQLCDRVEAALARSLRNTSVTIHVEPKESHPAEG
jgi:cation diffusion facilitator family transporter